MFKSFIIKLLTRRKTSSRYIKKLQKRGVKIGDHCVFFDPSNTTIDSQRPHMLAIGDYVKITSGVCILCHDYSRSVLANISGMANVGESKPTKIGDNVFIGINAIVLMGSTIGNNCIVGAGSVVSGLFPDNVVIAGNPAKIICTIEEFYRKRKSNEVDAAKEYVKSFRKSYGRNPNVDDMTNAFSWLYLPRNNKSIESYPSFFSLNGVSRDTLIQNFMNSKPYYDSFDDFLKDCNEDK